MTEHQEDLDILQSASSQLKRGKRPEEDPKANAEEGWPSLDDAKDAYHTPYLVSSCRCCHPLLQAINGN
jgi:hypothetical protein